MYHLGDLRSPHDHALLVVTKLSKSNLHVVQEQRQLKDMSSRTRPTSSESRASDSNGWGPRFNAHFMYLFFLFSYSKASDVNVAFIAILCVCEKLVKLHEHCNGMTKIVKDLRFSLFKFYLKYVEFFAISIYKYLISTGVFFLFFARIHNSHLYLLKKETNILKKINKFSKPKTETLDWF